MAKRVINLPTAEWGYDDARRLGPPSDFGDVFLGRQCDGESGRVTAKRLKLGAEEAAHRELRFGGRLLEVSFKQVVPGLDAGQDPQSDR